jgi:hypothetical protein
LPHGRQLLLSRCEAHAARFRIRVRGARALAAVYADSGFAAPLRRLDSLKRIIR